MAVPTILTPGFIYPLNSADVLNFYLFPDEMDIELSNGGGSEMHPSLGHSVTQLTGRGSPTFNFSLIFEGVEWSYPRLSGSDNVGPRWASIVDGDNPKAGFLPMNRNPAHLAYEWLMRHVGPRSNAPNNNRAQVFVMRLWEPQSQLVRLMKVSIKPMVVSNAQGEEGTIRRFRANFQGEYYYPMNVDMRVLQKRRRKRVKKGGTAKPETKAAAKAGIPTTDDDGVVDTHITNEEIVYRVGARNTVVPSIKTTRADGTVTYSKAEELEDEVTVPISAPFWPNVPVNHDSVPTAPFWPNAETQRAAGTPSATRRLGAYRLIVERGDD